MFIDFREEGETGVERKREKHQSVASCTHPNWGQNPQPRYVTCLGIEPPTFLCTG